MIIQQLENSSKLCARMNNSISGYGLNYLSQTWVDKAVLCFFSESLNDAVLPVHSTFSWSSLPTPHAFSIIRPPPSPWRDIYHLHDSNHLSLKTMTQIPYGMGIAVMNTLYITLRYALIICSDMLYIKSVPNAVFWTNCIGSHRLQYLVCILPSVMSCTSPSAYPMSFGRSRETNSTSINLMFLTGPVDDCVIDKKHLTSRQLSTLP